MVLTLGEGTTDEAIRALERQTQALAAIVTVEGVTPLPLALNRAAARVRSPFFVQCDADMVLDADCVEVMSRFVADDVGAVVGLLRDEILGSIKGVKLLRTECCRRHGFPDSVTPGSDFVKSLEANGWKRVFATRGAGPLRGERDTFGEHKPGYTHIYTFHRFRRLGTRMRARGRFGQFRSLLRRLGTSRHPMAPTATIGLCRACSIAS